jgi:threonine synthase
VRYVSTRGGAAPVAFADVVLGGLAPDGGLWVPDTFPHLEPAAWRAPRTYQDLAADLVGRYDGDGDERADSADSPDLAAIVDEAYATFDDPEVCPLRRLSGDVWLLELFHGPTLAFKDVALQLVGRLVDDALQRRGERATILVATSGDTGSAAIAACAGRPALDVIVLHPAGRVSEVQRRQMTTVDAPNVHNLAVEGTFDDCQDLVKTLFAEEALRKEYGLAAMNSINWVRVAAQAVYYAWAVGQLAGPVVFAVPSGNFGNALAGWVAHRMGVPFEWLIVATNRNDLLARWLATGVLERHDVVPTVTPAMDIQIPSNLERLLFELCDRDGAELARRMTRFRTDGRVEAPVDPLLVGARLDDGQTESVMADVFAESGTLIDPHTAVAVGAARVNRDRIAGGTAVVCLATAHPAKFPETVERATGVVPEVPARLEAARRGRERYETVPNDLDTVRAFLRRSVRLGA